MTPALRRDTVFLALTRPQMFGGVTYGFFIINAVVALELFLVFRSFWAVPLVVAGHVFGMVVCLREPRTIELWTTRVSRCPRIKNYGFWRCNSYQP